MTVDAINARLASDPRYQALVRQYQQAQQGGPASKNPAATSAYQAIVSYLDTNGLQPPDGYTPFSPTGQLVEQPNVTWKDIAFALSPVVAGLGAGAVGVGGGFGGTAGTGTGAAASSAGAAGSAGATGATVTGTVAAPGVAGGAGIGTAAAGGGGMGVWDVLKPFIGPAINSATQLGGAAIQAGATKEAAQIQAETAAKALKATQDIYQQERADLGPWRSTGGGAIQKLGGLWGVTPAKDAFIPGNPYGSPPANGLPTSTDGSGNSVTMMAPPGTTAQLPAGVPPGAISQNGPNSTPVYAPGMGPSPGSPNAPNTTQAALVTMQAPDGRRVQVPQAMVQQALQQGGQVINA